MYVYMGKLVSQGGRIGRELIDNKFPTVGLMTSAAWRLFGGSWTGYVLLQTVLIAGAIALLARSACRNLGRHTALPFAACALVLLNFRFAVEGGFQLEGSQAIFELIAAAAALTALVQDDARDSFLVGLAAGTAAMLKPSGLAVLAAFAVATLLRRRGFKRLIVHGLCAAAGLAVPALVTLAYLKGADLLAHTPDIWRQVGRYAAHSVWEPWDIGKWVVVLAVIGFPMLVRGAIFHRPGDRVTMPAGRHVLPFALLWMAAEIAAVVGQARMYPYHFMVLAAPAALLFVLIPRGERLVPLAAALVFPLLLSVYGSALVVSNARPPSERLAASDYLASHAMVGDLVWADSMPRLLVETGLSPGSRYTATFLWANDDEAAQEYCSAMLSDFERNRPRYILLPTRLDEHVAMVRSQLKELRLCPRRSENYARAWSDLRGYVASHYLPEAQVGRQTIYRRKVSYSQPEVEARGE